MASQTRIYSSLCAALVALFLQSPAFAAGTWATTLQARDLDGDGIADAFYDSDLKITWLSNANIIAGTQWDDADSYPPFPLQNTTSDGMVDLRAARGWFESINISGMYGLTGWRLPNSGFEMGTGLISGVNEMEHLYSITLGNVHSNDQPFGLTNTGPFTNVRLGSTAGSGRYWANTGDLNWFGMHFDMSGSGNSGGFADEAAYVWAVRDGDVMPVPEASQLTQLLLGLGAILSVGYRTRRKQRLV